MTQNVTVSDEQIIAAWKKFGATPLVAENLGIAQTTAKYRRRQCERKYGIELPTWNVLGSNRVVLNHDEGRVDMNVESGVVIVFSDGHFLPGVRSTMFRALLAMVKQLNPVAVHCNGDAFDGGAISRFPRIGWDKKPSVLEELNAVKERLGEIEAVTNATKIWELGNHCMRFELKLAANAPEFEGVPGFTLKEHFPLWKPCWTSWINGNVCITHSYHTGIHAVHNNLLKGQCHYVSSHTHSAKVIPWTGAQGRTLWGCDTGSIADSLGAHNVDYQAGRHGNHRSAFAVLTFKDGRLLEPELCQKWDEDSVQFRGHVMNADTLEIP